MNKIRRKAIEDLVTKMSALKGELEKIQDEEQNVFDNMPENLQSSERGMNSEEAIDLMGGSCRKYGKCYILFGRDNLGLHDFQ